MMAYQMLRFKMALPEDVGYIAFSYYALRVMNFMHTGWQLCNVIVMPSGIRAGFKSPKANQCPP